MRVPEIKVFLTARAVILVCAFLLALGMVGSARAATQYDYIATTKAARAKPKPVKAGSLTWECGGKGREHQCRIRGPWPTPGVSACQALAKQVGPITKYGHKGKWLTTKQLVTCNAGIQGVLPSPGVVQAPRGQTTKALPSPGVVQAPRGQTTKALPSPGVIQAPRGQIKTPLKTVPPAALRPPARITLSRTELDGMARTLNRSGSRRYQYVLFRRTPNRSKKMKLSVVRTESINGVLLNRDKAAMESLGGRYFDDHMGNLVLLSFLSDPAGNRVPYSVTATSWGENIFAADRDNDGIIDLVLGSHGGGGGGRLWMMAGDNFKRLWQCMEEAALSTGGNDMFNAASLCVPCLDPNREPGALLTSKERGCVNRRGDGGSGGAPLGGAFNSDAMQGLLGEPECGPRKQLGSITSQETSRRRSQFPEVQRVTIIEIDSATGTVQRTRTAETTYYPDGSTVRIESQARTQGRRIGDIYEERYEDSSGGTIVVQTNREGDTKVFHENESDEGGSRTSSMGQPGIDPDGMPDRGFTDPRCSGNKTAMAQGTMWGDFCRNKDGSHIGMMECARKMADSIYAISGGRCWQESGSAGGERIVCRQEERRSGAGSDGDPGVAPGDSDAGSTDDTRTGIGGGRRSGQAGRYIDTTPMGGFLAGLCAKGGCPDFENVRNVR